MCSWRSKILIFFHLENHALGAVLHVHVLVQTVHACTCTCEEYVRLKLCGDRSR